MCYIKMQYKKHNSIVHLSLSTLKQLKNDPKSCVEMKSQEYHLILHPFHLTRIGESIQEILTSKVSKFSREFDCILVGYENIKVIGYEAPMSDDTCFMHATIEADFYLFKPTIGSVLRGIINEKTADHIGCLVHQLFNVSIPKPSSNDLDDNEWLGAKANKGQEVEVHVTFLCLDARLPYIRAELIALLSEDSGISTSEEFAIPCNKITKFLEADEDEAPIQEMNERKRKKKKKSSEAETEQPPVKKKKAKKDKNKLIGELKEESEVVDKKKKKKSKKTKKEKRDKHDLDESLPDLNLDLLFGSQCSQKTDETDLCDGEIYLPRDSDLEEVLKDWEKPSEKKSKKRKHTDVDSEEQETVSPRKKSKKSKHK